jgi:hypothetical protein
MSERVCPIYTFRGSSFAPSGNTVVAVAPLEWVMAVYGGGGIVGEGGLSAAFGGAVVFKNEDSGEYFIGVWGTRNASRFRAQLRAKMQVNILREAPIARLKFWGAEKDRPKRPVSS